MSKQNRSRSSRTKHDDHPTPTREGKRNSSKNSMYITIIVVVLILVFTIPTAAYVYLSHRDNLNQPQTTETSKVESVKRSSSSKKASDESSSEQDSTTDTTEATVTTETSSDVYGSTSTSMSTTQSTTASSTTTSSSAATGTYTVKASDNLYRIALNHGMTQQELMQMNGLTSPTVSVGQVLKVKE